MSAEGWGSTPWPREHHEHLLALVRADNGGTLPEWALSVDLVYLADRANHPSNKHAFPGRRELERRWGLTEWATRRALRAPEWQAVCARFKIRLPERRLDGPPRLPTTDHPASLPPATPLRTSEAGQHAENHPADHPASLPPTTPPPSTRARPSPRLHVSTSQEIEHTPAPPSLLATPEPPKDTAPPWAAKVDGKGTTSAEYTRHVVRALAAIRGRDVDPARCGTDAAGVIGLWRALDRPPIGTLADELVLVAKWAQESREAENDIRGVRADGTVWGKDRSRDVSTLCVRKSWGDRLEAARRWAARTTEAQPRQAVSAMAPPEAKAPDPPPRSFRRHVVPNPIPPSRNHHLDLLK